jgi:hypothetical protein
MYTLHRVVQTHFLSQNRTLMHILKIILQYKEYMFTFKASGSLKPYKESI